MNVCNDSLIGNSDNDLDMPVLSRFIILLNTVNGILANHNKYYSFLYKPTYATYAICRRRFVSVDLNTSHPFAPLYSLNAVMSGWGNVEK